MNLVEAGPPRGGRAWARAARDLLRCWRADRLFRKGRRAQRKKRIFRAVRCFRLAAASGHPEAQFHLGQMYANGQGVAANQPEAVR